MVSQAWTVSIIKRLSFYAIEGIIVERSNHHGKMGHSERYEDGLFPEYSGQKDQKLFSVRISKQVTTKLACRANQEV